MKLGAKGRRAAIEILIECLRDELAAMPADDDTATAPSAAPPAAPLQSVPFLGRPMKAKFGGVCAVCKGSIQSGVDVIYNGAAKATAHARCGQDDGGRR